LSANSTCGVGYIAVKPGIPASDPCAAAAEHWKSAEAIGTVAAFEDHAARFPQCAFADLAKSRIAALTLPSSPLSAADVRRFNGTWISTVHCDAVQPNILEWSLKVVAIVKDGVLHGGRGVDGQPGWAAYDGQIAADGMIALSIKDITGDQKLSRQGVLPSGTRREWQALGKLEGSHGSAVALISRNCNFNFSRISSSEADTKSLTKKR
jgi:hypothetical protein